MNISTSILFNGYIGTVVNIAALRNSPVSNLTTGASIIVASANALGDGNGGLFVYDAQSTDADDGAKAIAPATGAGRWLLAAGRTADAHIEDALGTATDIAPSQNAITEGFGGPDGATLVGVGVTGLTGTRTADFYFKNRSTIMTADDRVVGDGATDCSAGAQAVFNVSAGASVQIPKGEFLLPTTLTIPDSGLTIEGSGEDTNLIIGSPAQAAIISAAAVSGKLRLYNMRLTGAGVVNGEHQGSGINVTNVTGGLELDTIWANNCASGSIVVNYSPTLRSDISMRNIKLLQGVQYTTGGEYGDLTVCGQFDRVLLENIYIDATRSGAGIPVANGLFVSCPGVTPDYHWKNATIRSVDVRGVSHRGVAIDSENPTPNFTSGVLTMDDIRVYNSAWEGIKTKNVDRIKGTNWYVEGCEAGGVTEIPGNLQGSVFINGCEEFLVSNVEVVNGGTDAFRLIGRAPQSPGVGGDNAGGGQAKQVISNLVASNCAQAALFIGQSVQGTVVNNVAANDCRNAICLVASPSQPAPTHVNINGVTARRCTGHGISVSGLSGHNIGIFNISNIDIRESSGAGIIGSYVDSITINGGTIIDSGMDGSNVWGIRLGNIGFLDIGGPLRITNATGTTQAYGISLGGGMGSVILNESVDCSGNATGSVQYTPATATKVRGRVQGWLEAVSASYDPPALAAGASTVLQSLTVAGAEVGDEITAQWSGDLSGAKIFAECAIPNGVRWWITNLAGAAGLDLVEGSAKVTVRKKQG